MSLFQCILVAIFAACALAATTKKPTTTAPRLTTTRAPPQDIVVDDFFVNCTSRTQSCNNAYTIRVSCAGSILDKPNILVQYTRRSNHCSSIFAVISADGGSSVQIGPTGYTRGPTNLPNTVSAVVTGANQPIHTISISAQGVSGGCNTGTFGGFGGSLRVKCLTCI